MAESTFGISRIEPLSNNNYALWSMRLGALIKAKHLYEDVIINDEPVKNEKIPASDDAWNDWSNKNDEVFAMIILTLSPEQAMTCRGLTKAKEVWNLLKRRHEGVERQRVIQLKIKLARMEKTEKENMDEYLTRAQSLANEIGELGTRIEENELISFIIEGLPRKYSEVTTAISSNPDIKYEVMREALLRFESKYDKTYEDVATKAFKVKEHKRGNCHYCGKFGHFARDCWRKAKADRSESSSRNSSKRYNSDISKGNKFGNKNKGSDYKNKNCKRNEYAMSVKTEHVNNKEREELVWMLDSGCTSHMTYQHELMKDKRSENVEISTAEVGRKLCAINKGDIEASSRTKEGNFKLNFNDVLYVPELNSNLMSVSSLVKKNKKVVFDKNGAQIYEVNTGELIAQGSLEEDAFLIRLDTNRVGNNFTREACYSTNEMNRNLWHRRLGHVNNGYIEKMERKRLVRGMDKLTGKAEKCEACIRSKLTRLPFKEVEDESTCEILERIHVDLCGPMPVESLGGSRYMLGIVDQYSRRYFVQFLSSKSEVGDRLKQFIERREKETGKFVKYVRSDNGSEFINDSLFDYYKKKGIKSERTTIHTPQSNGIAERLNRTLIEMARTLLTDASLPHVFWAEAAWTAAYVHNITPTKRRDRVPLEIWTNKKPSVQHLRVFGCKVFYRNDADYKRKFDVRSKPAVFVGYSRDRKAYRVYDLTDGKIHESRDVVFIENKNGYTSDVKVTDVSVMSNKNIVDELDYICIEHGSNLKVSEEENMIGEEEELVPEIEDANRNEVVSDQEERIVPEEEIQQERKRGRRKGDTNEVLRLRREQELLENELSLQERSVRRSSRERKPISKYVANVAHEEKLPKNYLEVINSKDKNDWIEAMNKEMMNMQNYKVWEVVDKPKEEKIIRSKWVFTRKETNGTLKYKARLVADGSKQRLGIDYDESYSPVMKHESLRTLLAVAAMKNLKVRFVDVETAYLNGDLNRDVYMHPPDGVEIEGGKVLHLKKSLYGLPEAGRCWYEKLTYLLKRIGMKACKTDPCVFIGKLKNVAIGFYVDDGIIVGDSAEVQKLIEDLNKEIKIKEMSRNIKFLGIEIEENESGFFLNQTSFVTEILRRFKMEACNPVKVPGSNGVKLDDYEDSEKVDINLYQEILGCIGYLVTGTRPDIAFTYSQLSQYAKDPREIHFKAIKKTLRYLQGSMNLCLHIKRNYGSLIVKSDASWCTTKDSKSFAGYTAKIGESLVSWKSRKQKIVTLSTMESELLGICEAVCEGRWLVEFLEEIGQTKLVKRPIKIETDSQSAIDWISNPKINARNKHISRKYHFIKDDFNKNDIILRHVKSVELETDIMTKDVSFDLLDKHRKKLGLVVMSTEK